MAIVFVCSKENCGNRLHTDMPKPGRAVREDGRVLEWKSAGREWRCSFCGSTMINEEIIKELNSNKKGK